MEKAKILVAIDFSSPLEFLSLMVGAKVIKLSNVDLYIC